MLFSINWNPNQSFLNIGFIDIRYYSLLFMIGFLVAYQVLKYSFKKDGISLRKIDSLMTYTIISTLIGARLGHVIFYDWSYFKNHLLEILLPFRFEPEFEFTGFAGLASHGAAIGIIIGAILFTRKNKEFSLIWLLDRGAVGAVLAGVFIRLGNFMNSEIIGKTTDCSRFLATRFLRGKDLNMYELLKITKVNNVDKAFDMIVSNRNYTDYLSSIPCRHPAQLYECFTYIFISTIMLFLLVKTNKGNQKGFLLGIFFILVWTARFIIEFFKESQGGFESILGILSTGQWLSIPLIVTGVYLITRKIKTT